MCVPVFAVDTHVANMAKLLELAAGTLFHSRPRGDIAVNGARHHTRRIKLFNSLMRPTPSPNCPTLNS